jgi:hypothetical protein
VSSVSWRSVFSPFASATGMNGRSRRGREPAIHRFAARLRINVRADKTYDTKGFGQPAAVSASRRTWPRTSHVSAAMSIDGRTVSHAVVLALPTTAHSVVLALFQISMSAMVDRCIQSFHRRG